MSRRMFAVGLLSSLILISAGCAGPKNVVQSPTGPRDAAVATACKANLRAIFATEQAFQAENGRIPTISELASMPGGAPKEPAGGSYAIDPATGAVTCSLGHGRYPE